MGAVAGPQREAVPADAAGIAGDRALRHEDAARQACAAGGILDVAGFVAGEGPEIAALGRTIVEVLRRAAHADGEPSLLPAGQHSRRTSPEPGGRTEEGRG